jgi:hypothetical protein
MYLETAISVIKTLSFALQQAARTFDLELKQEDRPPIWISVKAKLSTATLNDPV